MKKKWSIGILVICLVAGMVAITSWVGAGTGTKAEKQKKETEITTKKSEEKSNNTEKDITVEKSVREVDEEEFNKMKSEAEELEAEPQEGRGAEQGEAAGSSGN